MDRKMFLSIIFVALFQCSVEAQLRHPLSTADGDLATSAGDLRQGVPMQTEAKIDHFTHLARLAEEEGFVHAALRYQKERVRLLRANYPNDDWRIVGAELQMADTQSLVRLWNDSVRRQSAREMLELDRDVRTLMREHRMPEALPKAERLHDLTESLLGRKSHRYVISTYLLARVHIYLDSARQALSCAREFHSLAQHLYGDDHPVYATALMALGDALRMSEDVGGALDAYRKALRHLPDGTPGYSYQVVVMTGKARAYQQKGRSGMATRALDRGQNIVDQRFDEDPITRNRLLAVLHVVRSELVAATKGATESIPYLQSAIRLDEETGDTNSTNYFRTLAHLGSRLALSDDPERRAEGLEHLQRALDEFERRYGREGLFYAQTLGRRAQVHAHWEEWEEAAELFEHTLRVMKEHDVEQSLRYREFEDDYKKLVDKEKSAVP